MIEFCFRFFSRWPLVLTHAVGVLLGGLVWLLSASYRRTTRENAKAAGYGLSVVVPAVAHAGRMVAELPRLWLGRVAPSEWTHLDVLDRAFAPGKGVLFLTPHLGCFEITARSWAEQHSQRFGPLTVLYRPPRKAALQAMFARARNRSGLSTAPANLQGIRQMRQALRRGEAVGLLPDQVPPEGMGEWLPFFGRPAYTMTLAAKLALHSQAQIVLAWGERLSWGRGYRVHLSELSEPLADDATAASLQLNQAMERLVRECPQQYLWGYARYKRPRQEL